MRDMLNEDLEMYTDEAIEKSAATWAATRAHEMIQLVIARPENVLEQMQDLLELLRRARAAARRSAS